MATVVAPTMANMSASHIIKDKTIGITYMDTVTMSVGWVALSGPEQETSGQGPIIEDITDLHNELIHTHLWAEGLIYDHLWVER